MVSGAKLDKKFWGEAVLTATYLINRNPSNALHDKSKTPFEMWHNRKPSLNDLKVFGSTVYVHNKTRKRKFDEKSLKSILVGYEPNGLKLWDVKSQKFIVARDIIVDETNMINSRTVVEDCNNGLQKESMQHIFPNESTECIQSEIRNESTECIQSEIQNESTERIESEIWNKNTEFNQNNIMGEKSDIETDISNIHSTNPIEFVDCGLSSSDQMEVECKT